MTDRHPTYRLGRDFRQRLGQFVDRFIEEGFREFAAEFEHLDDYICRAVQEGYGADRLRRTPKEKYLLEAVAFSIYDEINREAFNRTRDTLIVLPDCLSLHNPDCERTDHKRGGRCQRCDKSCQSYHVMELAQEYGATVVFSKRKQIQQLEYWKEKLDNPGVIGIACLIMLAAGMRSAAEVDLPARGVLLSFSGCEHWNDDPRASRFAFDWLRSILEEKYGRDADSAADNR